MPWRVNAEWRSAHDRIAEDARVMSIAEGDVEHHAGLVKSAPLPTTVRKSSGHK